MIKEQSKSKKRQRCQTNQLFCKFPVTITVCAAPKEFLNTVLLKVLLKVP